MRFRRLLLLPATVLLVTCGRPADPPVRSLASTNYFDLKGFLDEQRSYLESVSPPVLKTTRAEQGPAEAQRLARINWERELAFFYEADLNKPALVGAYATTRAALSSGGERLTYTRRPTAKGAIRQMVIEKGPGGGIRFVRIEQDEQNLLFASGRTLTLRCDPTPDHNRLLEYAIAGRQKLAFFEETHYEVRGDIE